MDENLSEIRDDLLQFLIAVSELCRSAELARLKVEILTADRAQIIGIPRTIQPTEWIEKLADTGHPHAFWVNDQLVDLDTIIYCGIHAPT